MKFTYDQVINLTKNETTNNDIAIEEDCCGLIYGLFEDNLLSYGDPKDLDPYIFHDPDPERVFRLGHVINFNFCPECGEKVERQARSVTYQIEKPKKSIKKVEKTKTITYFEEEEVKEIETISLRGDIKISNLIRKYPGLIHGKIREEYE